MATTNEIFRLVFSGDTKGLTTSLTAGEAEMQASVQRIAGMMTGAATAITAAGVTASVAWDEATKTIVDGTGATGEVLDSLLESYQGVARFGPDAATAIADLNTHTGRTGPLLEQLAEKALKAGIDTAVLGGSIRRFNLVGAEQEALIDKLIVAGQAYGANVNSIQGDIGRYGGKLDELGLSMDEQIALAAVAQSENAKLRTVVRELKDGTGGWMEKMQAAVPVIRDSTGATESAYETGKRWRDVLSETTSCNDRGRRPVRRPDWWHRVGCDGRPGVPDGLPARGRRGGHGSQGHVGGARRPDRVGLVGHHRARVPRGCCGGTRSRASCPVPGTPSWA